MKDNPLVHRAWPRNQSGGRDELGGGGKQEIGMFARALVPWAEGTSVVASERSVRMSLWILLYLRCCKDFLFSVVDRADTYHEVEGQEAFPQIALIHSTEI